MRTAEALEKAMGAEEALETEEAEEAEETEEADEAEEAGNALSTCVGKTDNQGSPRNALSCSLTASN